MIAGYKGIGPEQGKCIKAENALAYAMERCGIRLSAMPADQRDHDEFCQTFLEWFYSGNWMPVEDNEQEAVNPWAS
jgi:hypothetical protein